MLVSLNEVEMIPLENLRIIRGMKLYQESFALVILENNGPGGALQELPLINLTGASLRRQPLILMQKMMEV